MSRKAIRNYVASSKAKKRSEVCQEESASSPDHALWFSVAAQDGQPLAIRGIDNVIAQGNQKTGAIMSFPFHLGQHVEVWFGGWDQWMAGIVKGVGYIGGVGCALVQLEGKDKTAMFRWSQMRVQEGLFGLVTE